MSHKSMRTKELSSRTNEGGYAPGALFFWRLVSTAASLLMLASMFALAQTAQEYNILVLKSNWKYLFAGLSLMVLGFSGLVVFLGTGWKGWFLNAAEAVTRGGRLARILAALAAGALPILLIVAFFHPAITKFFITGFWQRMALIWCLSLLGAFFVRTLKPGWTWFQAFGSVILSLVILYRVAVIFSPLSDYPFLYVWSEGSRYYGASLFFSQVLYGQQVALPVMHPAWHLLLTPPFMLGDAPIWVHRLWNALLILGLNSGLSLAVVKRLRLTDRFTFWMTAGWAFLFLLQALILVHLLACALIVVLGVRSDRFWRTALVVLIASIWAGLCRINWFPVPALIAITIHLLEVPVSRGKPLLEYLWKPALWFVLGSTLAFLTNLLYMRWTGNGEGGNYSSSLTSDLLWYRLLPNATYRFGVLPDFLLVSLPVLWIITLALRRRRAVLHFIRSAGMTAILLVLWAGGMLVSLKIGGGSNLHNLDAFLILLMIVGATFFFDLPTPESGRKDHKRPERPMVRAASIMLVLIIPISTALAYGKTDTSRNSPSTQEDLAVIQQQAEAAADEGGEVLFISYRHLLPMGMVAVPLEPEYELAYLMEMVMSHNRPYLDQFQADIHSQRYDLIVVEPLTDHYYERDRVFSEENNLWVQEVAIPVLCHYETVYASFENGFVLLVPRSQPCE